jgi:uncharacterized protein with FMN-binding domain
MKALKRILIVLGIVIMVVVIFLFWMINSQEIELSNVFYPSVNMNDVKDGTYIDEAKVGLVFVKVQVNVINNKLSEITILEHDNGLGKPAEVIIDKMIEANKYDVDAISGATTSSEAFKSAVGKALLHSYDN